VSSKADAPEVRSEVRQAGRLTEPTLAAVDAMAGDDVDSVICGLCSDVRPLGGVLAVMDWRLCGRLSTLLVQGTITGALGEKILFPTQGRLSVPRIFIAGWGPSSSSSTVGSERIKAMVEMLDKARAKRVAFALPEPATGLNHLVDEAEKLLGKRLVTFFAADPISPR
jgi:hypothetical protein